MKPNALQFGLTYRYLLHLALVGAFLSVLLVWNASLQQKKTVLLEMEQRGALLGESLSSACGLRYLLGDVNAIRYIFSRAKDLQDVVSISLIDRNGKEEIQVGESGRALENLSLSLGEKMSIVKNERVMVVRAPMLIVRQSQAGVADMLSETPAIDPNAGKSDYLGSIQITLSLDRSHKMVQGLILRSLLATLLIIFLGSTIAFYFFRTSILEPIKNLSGAMGAVREGNLHMSLSGVERPDEIGELTTSFNDMTRNLQRAEEALRKANSVLEERVKERTKDLEEALLQLKETQEKVVRSEKLAAIGQLASGVGHELRNPLGTIQNAIYYIRDALKENKIMEQDPTLGEFLDLAEGEIKSSTNIISDLLDFSRVGKLFVQPTDLNELMGSVRAVLSVPANIQVEESYDAGLPQMMIDPQRMKQVFINLANNACQAMTSGGKLTISTKIQPGSEGEPDKVTIAFKDQGGGISPENIKKIFEPLFTTKSKGTGLGLAICAGIVDSHGGKIQVESEPGRGSTFKVIIPIRPVSEAEHPDA